MSGQISQITVAPRHTDVVLLKVLHARWIFARPCFASPCLRQGPCLWCSLYEWSQQASATPSGVNPARSLEADSTHPSMRQGARQLFPLACSQLPSRGLLLDCRITSVEAMYHTHTVSSAITRLKQICIDILKGLMAKSIFCTHWTVVSI